MPVQFLTDEERERLSNFPEQIEEEDIIAFFTLSASDMKEIHKQRGERNKLGYAIQLCALRYMGFSPDSVADAAPGVTEYVAKQLHLSPESLPEYGTGLTYYTWTSDQLSQYGIKVLPATTRDAPFVLDEIYGNETELEIGEHTVDTAGQTEKIFGIFDISGLLFSPRLKDIGVQSLYRFRSTSMREYKNLKNRFRGVINEKRIVEMWDDLLRMEASFRIGWVTASLVLQKTEALPKNNELARAFQEYGRIPKTIHILRWYESETRRRRINKQLNKGEAVHSLREYIHHANKGKIRRKYYDEQQNQAACLNLVTNIVITWYTVYIAHAIDQLKAEGYPVNDEDVSYQWSTKFAGINVHGKISFNIEEELNMKGLRPLRKPDGK